MSRIIKEKCYPGTETENAYENHCMCCGGMFLGPKMLPICYECKINLEAEYQKELVIMQN